MGKSFTSICFRHDGGQDRLSNLPLTQDRRADVFIPADVRPAPPAAAADVVHHTGLRTDPPQAASLSETQGMQSFQYNEH